MTSRRLFLSATAGLAATVGLAACGAPAGGGGTALRLGWWGNETRNKMTNDAIAAFQTANPGVTVAGEPGEWASYWEKLATQTAGNDAPDVIQMSINYIREYGDRGALLDLKDAGVESGDLAPGTIESGQVGDKLYGINGGVNSSVIVGNPTLFEKAGVDLPDDTTWTWESYRDLAAELTAKLPKGTYGSTSFWGGSDTMFNAWLRQHGKALYTETSLGFDVADAQGWLELMQTFLDAKAIPTAAETAEDDAKPLAQQMVATDRSAMSLSYSNIIAAIDQASGHDMALLRPPSVTGKAAERQAWFNASMLWSISARSKNPELAGKLVNFLVNSVEGGEILLAERGLPANTKVREAIKSKLSPADQKAATFLTEIEPELGTPPIIPIAGASDLPAILQRHSADVAFGRKSPADAATAFVDEVTKNIKR